MACDSKHDILKPAITIRPRALWPLSISTLTNLRVVRDEDSPTGWKLPHDPFPGWKTVPTW